MTVTRIFQTGFELQHSSETDHYTIAYGTSAYTINTIGSRVKTGAASAVVGTGAYPFGKLFSSTTQIRGGFFFRYAGSIGSSTYTFVAFVTGTYEIIIGKNLATNDFDLVVNGTVRDSVAFATAFPLEDTFYHVGVAMKADSSTGFVSVYVDGVQQLTWTGNTGTSITGFYATGRTNGLVGWSSVYVDDFYVDDTVGEADAAPPSPRFSFLLPNGAGNYTNWTANTGSNYAAVDETGAPDDETTYVYATSSGVQDSYALTNTTAGVTVPAGYAIDAVIPIAWARKTDAGTASTLKLGTRLSGTNAIGSAQSLTTSFGPVWERQTTDPGAGAWSEADIDSTEIVLESAGAF
jgi:hypothetical protein